MGDRVRVTDAPHEYDQELEQFFRREVENVFFEMQARLDQVASGNSTVMSLHSKREHYIIPPLGVVTI